MSQDQTALTVIDATDAQVLPPEGTPVELSAEERKTLDTCQFHLHRLGRRIAAREVDLIYLYVEFGWQLSKAQSVYATEGSTVGRIAIGGLFSGRQAGFEQFLERSEVAIPKTTAYRYIQAAKNAGLTAESSPDDVKALRDAAKLAGQTLTTLCRKPVDKTDKQAETHEVTPEEAEAERLAEIKEAWRKWGEFSTEHGITAQDWMDLAADERESACGIAHELYKLLKSSLRKPLPTPGAAQQPA